MGKTSTAADYERSQNYNFLTKWMHSFRYKELNNVFDIISKKIGDRPIKVYEIGAAYGRLFDLLNAKYNIEYVGIELFEPLYKIAVERFGGYSNAKFLHGSCLDAKFEEEIGSPDVIITLETLEHIPEHDVVRLIEKVKDINPSFFICSVPVEIGPSIWLKNVGSLLSGYMRHKEYTWKETFYAGLYKLDRLPAHETGHKGFDWRWLAQTIRHNMKIIKLTTFPLNFIPAGFASSIFIVAAPRNT